MIFRLVPNLRGWMTHELAERLALTIIGEGAVVEPKEPDRPENGYHLDSRSNNYWLHEDTPGEDGRRRWRLSVRYSLRESVQEVINEQVGALTQL